MAQSDRQYDFVVFGATGYTGKLTCEHIVQHLPENLKWAVAGRSASKLQAVLDEIRPLNTNRTPAAVEECSLDKTQLSTLAKKTKIILTTVGPYSKYGTPVLEACIENGTHYFDVTGETPWVYDMVRKYHDKAKANKVIAIPQIGLDSAPADLVTLTLVQHIKQTVNKATDKVFFTMHKIKGGVSGGTLASLFGIFEAFSAKELQRSMYPWSLSPVKPNQTKDAVSLLSKITGVKTVSDLGVLTTSLQGPVDRTQVYRSWGLQEGTSSSYGPRFRFYPFMTARNALTGFFVHAAIAFGGLMLFLSPVRALLRRFVYAPGNGPTKEQSKNDFVEYRAIGEVDSPTPGEPNRAFARLYYEGNIYQMTGAFLAEAGYSLLHDPSLAKELGGGILTPATLGPAYIERLQKVGFRFDVRTMA